MAENNTRKTASNSGKYAFRRFCALAFLAFGLWYFNNYSLKTTYASVSSEKITQPVRLTILSDLHAHEGSISNNRIMKKIKDSEPDAVFVLGDMYSRKASENEIDIAVELITNIVSEGYNTYFVSGDHDTSASYIASLAAGGVHVMNYISEYAEINGSRFKIMGIDNVYYTDTFDLDNIFTTDYDCFNILLAHIPNFQKFAQFGADLTLCADTHGGMVQLPFGLGTVYDTFSGTWFPEQRTDGDVYDKGMFNYDGGAMFITSGIGDSPYPVRLFNRPEIVSLEILPKEATGNEY